MRGQLGQLGSHVGEVGQHARALKHSQRSRPLTRAPIHRPCLLRGGSREPGIWIWPDECCLSGLCIRLIAVKEARQSSSHFVSPNSESQGRKGQPEGTSHHFDEGRQAARQGIGDTPPGAPAPLGILSELGLFFFFLGDPRIPSRVCCGGSWACPHWRITGGARRRTPSFTPLNWPAGVDRCRNVAPAAPEPLAWSPAAALCLKFHRRAASPPPPDPPSALPLTQPQHAQDITIRRFCQAPVGL